MCCLSALAIVYDFFKWLMIRQYVHLVLRRRLIQKA